MKHSNRTTLWRLLLLIPALALLTLSFGLALAQSDGDGDGVDDNADLCPVEDASLFDYDGDGCIDATANARHIEFWLPGDLPFRYVIHEVGAPLVGDGSDFTAVQAGMDSWVNLPNSLVTMQYEGTTPEAGADALDGINQVSFKDPDFAALYGTSVIAVGVTTSFTTPDLFLGNPVLPGQIVDADLLFNPDRTFSTATAGQGPDLQSTATHEAGHLLGINHSAVATATMFPALQAGSGASSLEIDDEIMAFMAYPDPGALANATVLEGSIKDGATNGPIPGAAVIISDAATSQVIASQFTLPDGSYRLTGLAPGSYHVFVHPLDGTVGINGVVPGLINDLIEQTAQTLFVPEYYDAAESATDDSDARTAVDLTGGATTIVDIITNIDAQAPSVLAVLPTDGEQGVRSDAVLLVNFDEVIDFDSFVQNFKLDKITGAGPEAVGGTFAQLSGDNVIVFTPAGILAYDTEYRITIEAGVNDPFGNATANDVVSNFFVGSAPALELRSISPQQVVGGTVAVISGTGFINGDPAGHTVDFGGVLATPTQATPTRLVVTVPVDLPLGDFELRVTTPNEGPSLPIDFSSIRPTDIARGTDDGEANLSGTPRALAALPDGKFVFVATSSGVASVLTDPQSFDYRRVRTVDLAGGTRDIAVAPDGARVYAVARSEQMLHVINSDYGSDATNPEVNFNTTLDARALAARPLGIVVDPGGESAYIADDTGDIQRWDLRLGSSTFHRQIGEIETQILDLNGAMAIDPTGGLLIALRSSGTALVYSTATGSQLASISVGLDPRAITVAPQGNLAYVTTGSGNTVVISLTALVATQTISHGGSLRGIGLTPTAGLGYVANRDLDRLDVLNLLDGSSSFRTVASTIAVGADPVDVAVSPDGLRVFTLEEQSGRLSITSIGFGPVIEAVVPEFVRPGDIISIVGSGFAVNDSTIAFPDAVSRVWIDETPIDVSSSNGSSLWVKLPNDFSGGAIRVSTEVNEAPIGVPLETFSNPAFVKILDPATSFDPFSAGSFVGPTEPYDFSGAGVDAAITVHPSGRYFIVEENSGQRPLIDWDSNSPTYLRPLAFLSGVGRSIDFTPDGKRGYAIGAGEIQALDLDPDSPSLGSVLSTVSTVGEPFTSISRVDVVPTGEWLLLTDTLEHNFLFADISHGGARDSVVASTGTLDGTVDDVAMHPSGRYAYAADATLGRVEVISFDPFRPEFLSVAATITPTGTPHALQCSPDGTRLFIGTRNGGLGGTHELEVWDLSNPIAPQSPLVYVVETGSTPDIVEMEISPNGDRLLFEMPGTRVAYLDVEPTYQTPMDSPAEINTLRSLGILFVDYGFSAEGDQIVMAEQSDTGVLLYDRSNPIVMGVVSGDQQTGIAGQKLPAPVVVRLVEGDGRGSENATLEVLAPGSQLFNGESFHIFRADENGEVAIEWTLGDTPGASNVLQLTNPKGASQVLATATAVVDPETLPLELAQVAPASGAVNVSVTTTLQATFSKAVAPASVDETSVILRKVGDPAPIAVRYGFSDGARKLSLIPVQPLDFTTNYELEITTGVKDVSGLPLPNGSLTEFTTKLPPPLVLSALSPPSGAVGAQLVLTGQGFDAELANNVILFGGIQLTPIKGGVNFLRCNVPLGATTGAVRVQTTTALSEPLNFSVLVPTNSPVDQIVTTLNLGFTAQSIAITPDGSRAYSVSSETDQVIPLDLVNLTNLPPIAVGESPVAIVINPAGTLAYVANYAGGSISVIDILTNAVVATIPAGNNPQELVMDPSGDRVYAVSAVDQEVLVIDADPISSGFNTVVETLRTGSSTRGATVSPDASELYLGTGDGFLIISLEANSYGAVESIRTGSSTRTATVSPDGGLLVLVTTDDEILIVDISAGGSNQVVESIRTGSSTRGATVSPDGGLLYVLLEDIDDILVYSIDVQGSISVVESPDAAQFLVVSLTLVSSVQAGDDPNVIAFDPSGSGFALVGNAGDGTISLLNSTGPPPGVVEATVIVDPRPLYLPSMGRYILATVDLPDGHLVQDIRVESVRMQGVIPADPNRVTYVDTDGDSVDEVIFEFDRQLFQPVVAQGYVIPITVDGLLNPSGQAFAGEDTIRTQRPNILFPSAGTELFAGLPLKIIWTSPPNVSIGSVDVYWSPDNGETWFPIKLNTPNTGFADWTVPNVDTQDALIMVILYDKKGDPIGIGMNESSFTIIDESVAVAMRGVSLEAINGDAVLRWRTAPIELGGFHVLRGSSEYGPWERVSQAPVTAVPGEGEMLFEFRDPDLQPNRNHYYMLEEAWDQGAGFLHGPYKVSYVVGNALEQNYPNSFNPVTTIRFSVAKQGKTRLTIYNLAGRQVKVLVDDVLKPDNYEVQWRGVDDDGSAVASGIYLYSLETTRFRQTKKMVLVR